jgi:hypothetical protein
VTFFVHSAVGCALAHADSSTAETRPLEIQKNRINRR